MLRGKKIPSFAKQQINQPCKLWAKKNYLLNSLKPAPVVWELARPFNYRENIERMGWGEVEGRERGKR